MYSCNELKLSGQDKVSEYIKTELMNIIYYLVLLITVPTRLRFGSFKKQTRDRI
jgi:hypothetical protein